MYNIYELWTIYLKSKEFKPENLYKVTSLYNRHILSYWQNDSLDSLTMNQILEYRSYLFSKGLSPQSVKNCLSLMRAILNRAKQLESFSGKVPYFEMPKFDNKRTRVLTKDEADTLLTTLRLKSELWHDITQFALHTGLRAGEIFSLKPSSINQFQRTAVVHNTKNKRSKTIALNDLAFSLACKYQEKHLQFLFSDKPIKRVSKIFGKTVKKLRLNENVGDSRDKFVFHSLRHTFASWLVLKGVAIVTVNQLLGHANLQTTMRYAHLAPEQGQLAVNLLMDFV